MALNTLVQIEGVNREIIDAIHEAINDVFNDKVPKLKQDAQKIIDEKNIIDTGRLRRGVNSGFVKFEDINTLFIEASAIRPGKKTDYAQFQEFGTIYIKRRGLFVTGSFKKNTRDILQLIDKETQKQMDKI